MCFCNSLSAISIFPRELIWCFPAVVKKTKGGHSPRCCVRETFETLHDGELFQAFMFIPDPVTSAHFKISGQLWGGGGGGVATKGRKLYLAILNAY